MQVTPANVNAAGVYTKVYIASTANTVTINVGTTALAASTAYAFNYSIIGE